MPKQLWITNLRNLYTPISIGKANIKDRVEINPKKLEEFIEGLLR